MALAALTLVAGCGHNSPVAPPAKGDLTGAADERLAKLPISGFAQVDATGTQVNVMAEYGGCQRPPRLTATATATAVNLTLYQVDVTRPNSPCPTIMRTGRAGALLSAPLGKRALVDAVSGRTLPYFDGKHLAKVGYLPPGYGESGTVATMALPGRVSDSGVSWTRQYAPVGGKPGQQFVLQQTVHLTIAPEAPPTGGRPVTVHGKPAVVSEPGDSVLWFDGGYKFVLQTVPSGATPAGGTTLSADELVRVANGVTLPG